MRVPPGECLSGGPGGRPARQGWAQPTNQLRPASPLQAIPDPTAAKLFRVLVQANRTEPTESLSLGRVGGVLGRLLSQAPLLDTGVSQYWGIGREAQRSWGAGNGYLALLRRPLLRAIIGKSTHTNLRSSE